MPRTDAGVMLATFSLTVIMDLTVAVMVGLVLSAAVFLHRMSSMTTVGTIAHGQHAELMPGRFETADIPHDVQVYSIDGPFFFGAASQFQAVLGSVAHVPKVVILRLRNVPYLDASGLNALERAIEGFRKQGSRVLLSAIQAQPLDMMERTGVVHLVGDAQLFRDTASALAEARRFLGLEPKPTSDGTPGGA
jgi:SulP family sulfate permease